MGKIVFNPVKEDESGKVAKRMIWSTESLDLALRGLEQGRKLIANPFYEGNTQLLKGDLVFDRTPEEIVEFKRCMDDIIYFSNTYGKLMTPEGVQHITLRDYQEQYLKQVEANQLNIMLSARQAGKTTTSAIFMLHYVCFNSDKNALILGNKRGTAVDILNKFKSIFYELPYFLKPGVLKWNDSEIVFDNGCRIKAEATTINSGIGMTIHCALLDEFAHVAPNILDKFYNNLLPVVTAAKGKVLITSTQNGYNLFYRLWISAKSGDSSYVPFEVTWDMIPEWNPETRQWEKRDEKWHRMQVANYGSEEAFNSQFGTSFDISSNTLISQQILNKRRTEVEIFQRAELPGISLADCYYWKPGYEPLADLKKDYIIITCDIAEGLGQDSTVYQFNRLVDSGLECVGFFRCNDQRRETCADSLADIVTRYCDSDHTLVSFEKNTYGDLFLRELQDYKEGVFPVDTLVRYNKNKESKHKFDFGVKITSGNKTTACKLFKERYELGKLKNTASLFVDELGNFVNDGSDHFAASFGHDDCVMAEIQTVFVQDTLQYKLLREEYETASQIEQKTATAINYSSPLQSVNGGGTIYDF